MGQQPSRVSLGRGVASVYSDVFSAANLRASLHHLISLPIGIAAFVTAVVLVSLTAGLLVVLPLAMATGWLLLVVIGNFAEWERARLRVLLGATVDPPRHKSADGMVDRLKVALRDAATWREIAYAILLLPVGILSFTVTLVAWTVPGGLIVAAAGALPVDGGYLTFLVLVGLAGVALAAFIPFPVAAVTRLYTAMARTFLGRSSKETLEERVTQLSTSRSRLADTAGEERRRIERDLHDGAQQRLVSLAMSLGQAREKLESDVEGARMLVEEAHAETKQAMAELRDLARGIHPAVLADRGLEAALTPVVALSPFPVTLNVEVPERPDPRVETIAYFVVSETLANIAKHAAATRATVSIALGGDRLVVEVTDDGVGGANPGGHGLSGLRNRVEAVEGWFSVASPPGGPTTVTADLPTERSDPV